MKIAILCLLLAGCATKPQLPPQIHPIAHKCDQWGVSAIDAVVSGPGVVHLEWGNAAVCGTPS